MAQTLLFKGKGVFTCLFFLFLSQSMLAQLTDFTLTVTVTNESRTANGTLNSTASNTIANGIDRILTETSFPTQPIIITSDCNRRRETGWVYVTK
jgi:hypothetical protein